MKSYDYIITGAGAAGLSLAVRLVQSGRFNDRKILLVDQESKNRNDRTWCFWEEHPGFFEGIVSRSWEKMVFRTNDGKTIAENIYPYRYKLIRGIDFYNYCLEIIRSSANIEFINGSVSHVDSDVDGATAVIDGSAYRSTYVFNSIIFDKPTAVDDIYLLQQHFKGWFIKTNNPVFDAEQATLMDFDINQQHGTAFFYVMPFSSTHALVEYTLFTPSLLTEEAYETALRSYCSSRLSLKDGEYIIEEKEKGSIPMTNFSFDTHHGNVIHIGTAGGQTRGSTGYTFNFIQRNSDFIVHALKEGKFPAEKSSHQRDHFYDSVLLNILAGKKMDGATIFSQLFLRNKMQEVFKFLDNETSISEEINLISKLPVLTFSGAALSHLQKKIFKAVKL